MLSCLAVCVVGMVVAAGLAAGMHYTPTLSEALGGWAIVVFALPVPLSIVLAGRRYGRLNRQRIARLAPACTRMGFHMPLAAAPEASTTFFAPLAGLENPLTLHEGAKNLAWWAHSEGGSGTERLFEHEFHRGAGKTTQLYPHTVLAWPWSHRDVPPGFVGDGATYSVSRSAGVLRGFPFPHGRPLHTWTGSKITWAVDGDVAAASRFLSPRVQTEMESAPVGEWWYVGNGWICCVFVGKCDADNLAKFVVHARAVLAAGA